MRYWGLMTAVLWGLCVIFASGSPAAVEMEEAFARDCAECHGDQVGELAGTRTAHRALGCTDCHQTHTGPADCTDCHSPHGEAMSGTDCRSCHAPHNPLPIRYWAGISPELCAACHGETVEQFERLGAAHQLQVGCFRCHREHPPAPASAPAACNRCHQQEKNAHFALTGCRSCHIPHAPRAKPLAEMKNLRAACVSCHPRAQQDAQAPPAVHAGVECFACHQLHRLSADCRQCHESHAESMGREACRACHPPHAPTAIRYDAQVPAQLCAACHQSEAQTLAVSGGAHGQALGCAQCHIDHPPQEISYPACARCHGPAEQPHFTLEGCDGCHPAHAPLAGGWAAMENLRPACLSCHSEPAAKAEANPSPHAGMDCTDCHQAHGQELSCLDCHQPHGPAMGRGDCRRCHDPHQPTVIAFVGPPIVFEGAICTPCHGQAVSEVQTHGAAHQSALECLECHGDHPDAGCRKCHSVHPQRQAISASSCTDCHQPAAKDHFAIGGCAACHPPHRPLQVDLAAFEPLAPACLSCHQAVGRDRREKPSAHAYMDCSQCHEKHVAHKNCQECHQPHAPQMSYGDCITCHRPHTPRQVAYPADLPQVLCTPCHAEPAKTLAAEGGPHGSAVSCAACHPAHPPEGKQTVASCRSCHPRLQKRHYTVEPCLPCHVAHAPKRIDLAVKKEVKPVCLSCHHPVGRFMDIHPSEHAGLDCHQCHTEHRDHRECSACHQPHSAEMGHADCLICHEPHTPTQIRYFRKVPAEFCAACHQEQSALIADQGGAHRLKGGCVRCHRNHPPNGRPTAAACARCHDPADRDHYAVAGCEACHRPHAPRDLDFTKVEAARPACVSCHRKQDQAMRDRPSAHNGVDCSRCHLDHRQTQACDACHPGHSADMAPTDCRHCHPAHTPNRVAFAAQVPPGFCSVCHQEVAGMLAGTSSRHQGLNCLDCHQGEHGAAMACDSCHGWPHEPALLQKYPDCRTCHGNPHDLAPWKVE